MERVVVARSLAVDVDAVWCVPSSSESNRSSKASNSVREEEGLADGGASSISRSLAREVEGEGLLGVGVRGVGGSLGKAAAHPGDGQRSAHGLGGSGRFLRVAVGLPWGRGGFVVRKGFSIIIDA